MTVTVETRATVAGCPSCGVVASSKGRRPVSLVDCCQGFRTFVVVWLKRRWQCLDPACSTRSWTEEDRSIAAPRLALTDRAGRWVTEEVGRYAHSVNEIAVELGCDWHTVNDTVIAYGTALVADPERFGTAEALGLDEVLFARVGTWHRQGFSTQMVNVGVGQLLDVDPGRSSTEPMVWLSKRGKPWRDQVRFATLDLSGPYRKVFTVMVPDAVQVADPFHVVKLANTKLDECRRRVQNETMGHRGHKADPLYRCRRLLTKAEERLDDKGRDKLMGLLKAGDPKGDVATVWKAKEAVRELYAHRDPDLALQWVTELSRDLQDQDYPIEARSLGRTLKRWKHQIAAWHAAQVSNGPTEAVNNLIKRVKRAAFGFTLFRKYRIRSLLYAGKPNWDLLKTIKPEVIPKPHPTDFRRARNELDYPLRIHLTDLGRIVVDDHDCNVSRWLQNQEEHHSDRFIHVTTSSQVAINRSGAVQVKATQQIALDINGLVSAAHAVRRQSQRGSNPCLHL